MNKPLSDCKRLLTTNTSICYKTIYYKIGLMRLLLHQDLLKCSQAHQVAKWFFTAESSYASAVLGIEILSVRPSDTRVLCNETKEHTAIILTLRERVISLVFWCQQRLVGDVPSHLKCALKVTHPLEKRRLRPISAYKVCTVRTSKKIFNYRE